MCPLPTDCSHPSPTFPSPQISLPCSCLFILFCHPPRLIRAICGSWVRSYLRTPGGLREYTTLKTVTPSLEGSTDSREFRGKERNLMKLTS